MHHHKGFIGIALLLIIVIAAIGGLFYFGVMKGNLLKPPPERTVTQQFDQEVRRDQTTSNVDTSNWKTYSNPQFSFTFKYPTDLIEDRPFSDKERPSVIGTKLYSEKEPYRIEVMSLLNKSSVNEFTKGIPDIQKIEVDGQPATKQYADLLDVKTINVYIQNKDSTTMMFNVQWNEDDKVSQREKYESLTNQILSTFHFLD